MEKGAKVAMSKGRGAVEREGREGGMGKYPRSRFRSEWGG
jgi:hypothetical protein